MLKIKTKTVSGSPHEWALPRPPERLNPPLDSSKNEKFSSSYLSGRAWVQVLLSSPRKPSERLLNTQNSFFLLPFLFLETEKTRLGSLHETSATSSKCHFFLGLGVRPQRCPCVRQLAWICHSPGTLMNQWVRGRRAATSGAKSERLLHAHHKVSKLFTHGAAGEEEEGSSLSEGVDTDPNHCPLLQLGGGLINK